MALFKAEVVEVHNRHVLDMRLSLISYGNTPFRIDRRTYKANALPIASHVGKKCVFP